MNETIAKVTDAATFMTSAELVAQRRKTNGDWKNQGTRAQGVKNAVFSPMPGPISEELKPWQREALEMICVKLSRIVTGNPDEPDHWRDIAGYARLGERGHE